MTIARATLEVLQEYELVKPMRQLVDAILAEDGAQVRALWSQYPNLAKDPALWWPLHTAAQRGDIDILRFLLDHGADVHGTTLYHTPLQLAARRWHHDMIELLIARGARVDIFVATALGQMDRVTTYLDADPALANTADEFGATPLLLAAEQWHVDVMRLLIDRGASLNTCDERGNTVLHYAAHYQQSEGEEDERVVADERLQRLVAELLVAHGANVNAKDWHRVTPLHRACRFAYLGIADVLLRHGADPNARNVAGDTPLHRAVKNPLAFALVELLLTHGADLSARDKKGTSILRAARGKAMKEYLRRVGATD